MKRGDAVSVRVYPSRVVERIVWEVASTYIVVCQPEVYKKAIAEDTQPESFMGFPREDVNSAGRNEEEPM